MEWILKSLTNAHGTLFFKRSITGGFSMVTSPNPGRQFNLGFIWSLNDFFTVAYARRFDLLNHKRIEESVSSIFNSPSECWQLRLNYTQKPGGTDFGFDLALNLMGTGYLGVNSTPAGALPEKSPAVGGI